MKMDQVAFLAVRESQIPDIKASLGLAEAQWTEDEVTGRVVVHHGGAALEGLSRAKLLFNYDRGIELEILHYVEGPHWHANMLQFLYGEPHLSHLGHHLEDQEPWPETPWPLVQEMWTESHTNPAIALKRTYHYRIHDARQGLGVFLKFIRRINAL